MPVEKYRLAAGTAALLLAVSITACKATDRGSADSSGTEGSTVSGSTTAAAGTAVSAADIDLEFTARDLEVGYEESTAVKITLNGSGASVTGSGASAADGAVTITAAGTYVVSGTLDDGQLIVNAGENDKVQIVLNGASIHCEDHAAIYVRQADKVFLTLAEGTENALSDGTDYVLSADEESNVDGVIFSKADLTINGGGSLTVAASYKHGIVSKDDLVITGGTIIVTANGQGLNGKDCVKIRDGVFTLNTQSDGIQSDNTEDTARGYIYIAGGQFDITAETDGLQAETVLRIDGGTFCLTTGEGSDNASTDAGGNDRPGWGNWGGFGGQDNSSSAATDTASAKGLKAGSELVINGGTFTVDSSDDSIHCNGDATIAGGVLSLSSGDDGVHADDALLVSGGTIHITKSYEGLEGANITVSGGEISLVASDDGLNAAGGNDGSSQGGRPGQNSFTAGSSYFIKISGGTLRINAGGDGIDSNGTLAVEGGETYVSGPTDSGNGALDYETEATISGGIFVAVGSTGMAEGFSSSSTQCSLLYNLSSSVQSGGDVILTDADGNTLVSFTPEKTYQSVVVSAPGMAEGDTVTLKTGTQSNIVTLTSIVTSNGGGMGGGMGDPHGGMGGGPGGR